MPRGVDTRHHPARRVDNSMMVLGSRSWETRGPRIPYPEYEADEYHDDYPEDPVLMQAVMHGHGGGPPPDSYVRPGSGGYVGGGKDQAEIKGDTKVYFDPSIMLDKKGK